MISSYSNVRLQQPRIGLSVESEMPKEMLMNPELADEPPAKVDKVESIFMKDDQQIRGLQKMEMDEETMMRSINDKPSEIIGFDITKSDIQLKTVEHIIDVKDLMMMFPTQQSTTESSSTTVMATTPTSVTTTEVSTTKAAVTTEDNLLPMKEIEEVTMEPFDLTTTTTIEDLETDDVTTERT